MSQLIERIVVFGIVAIMASIIVTQISKVMDTIEPLASFLSKNF